ncbi:MAG: hypothetical protein ACRED0_08385 [Gammaproteobacteria bacterium]
MEKYRVAIPVTENWILYLLGALRPELRAYIFWDARKALERGIGMCGHVSATLVRFLREKNIDAKIVGLNGHVVVQAEVEADKFNILDADVGVVIPQSLKQVEQDTSLARQLYEEAFLRTGIPTNTQGWNVDLVIGYYASASDNSIDHSGRLGYLLRSCFSARMVCRERGTGI